MQRRRLLVALGTGVTFSGCLGSEPPRTPTASDETTRRPSTRTDDVADATDQTPGTTTDPQTVSFGRAYESPSGETATVHDVSVRRTVFTRSVHVDPHFRSGEQFLVVDASVSDRDLLRQFELVADGEQIDTRRIGRLVEPFGEPTDELLGLAVPAPLDADRGAVTWRGPEGGFARWPLADDHLHALANPPEFEVRGFEIAETVERGSSFPASLTIANAGSGDGTFFAELGATTISDVPEIRVEVPAGETVSVERTVDPHYREGDDELTVVLNWGADRLKRATSVTD